MVPDYVELHCHSYFSLLDGASSPEALVERAAALGYPALALTDHDGLYGAVRFWRAARERGLRPLIGAEVTLVDGGHLTLLAEDQRGYANLCRLISAGKLARRAPHDRPPGSGGSAEPARTSGPKGPALLTIETLAEHAEGLLCLSGCRQGAVATALLARDEERARQAAAQLRDIFSGRFWIELQRHDLPTDARLTAELVALARRLDVEVVATNNVHYANRSGQRLHDVLTCVRQHTTLHQALAGGLLHPNSERFLKSPQAMATRFADLPQALRETCRVAERCHVCLDFAAKRLPAVPLPHGQTPASYLRALCEAGLGRKFDPVSPQARAQLEHELTVIGRAGLAGYFLVVWDIVQFARGRGIRCQRRGSAANKFRLESGEFRVGDGLLAPLKMPNINSESLTPNSQLPTGPRGEVPYADLSCGGLDDALDCLSDGVACVGEVALWCAAVAELADSGVERNGAQEGDAELLGGGGRSAVVEDLIAVAAGE